MSVSITVTETTQEEETVEFQLPRLVSKKILCNPQSAGIGAVFRRAIGGSKLKLLDPFLILDHFQISPPAGFPDHPHRGFENVTYVLEGGISYEDFLGHKGTIRKDEVQWATVGRGIVHSEMPAGEGPNTGLQLWINLSSKDKMVEPNYQDLSIKDIPVVVKDGVQVKIIAGQVMGVCSPVHTRTPIMYLDFTLKPNAQYHQRIEQSWNAFVYTIEGEGVFGIIDSSPSEAHHLLVLGPGDGLSVWNKSCNPLRFVLIGGQPINEPVVQHGFYVMNTQDEIDKSVEDYKDRKNGFEMAKHWKSSNNSN